ncbi:MAG TPA: hypothetical protein PKI20_15395 [Verrucomicrobiota bacterium]|jgi:hypothetical protein|nr:hypothetical protein [Verrucomicrobiota bacterium]HQL79138.1 hypothetical protein [Verrucomicrobiota bacterium]
MNTLSKTLFSFLILLALFWLPQAAPAYYDPGVQRWITRDPFRDAGFEALRDRVKDRSEPATNPFLYVENDPSGEYDAFGLHTEADCDADKATCDQGCRDIKGQSRSARFKRAMCWGKCMSEYAACLATTTKGLVCIGVGAAAGIGLIFAPEVTIPILIYAPK